ncbi:hypothetical protein ACVOMT_15790 [Sphingomonas panni]
MPPAVQRASPSGNEDGRDTGDQSGVSEHVGVDDRRLRGRRRDQQFGQRSDATADQRFDADAQPIADTRTCADSGAKSDTVAEPHAVAESVTNAVSDAVTYTRADTGSHANANSDAARLFGAGAAAGGIRDYPFGQAADPLGQRHARVPPQLRRQ